MKKNNKNRAIIAESIARSWKDETFKNQFVNDPKATLEAAGAEIDPGHEVCVVENTSSVVNAVLPAHADQPEHSDQIDAGLEQLRGLSEGVEVRVHRDTAQKSFIALPEAPGMGGDLSDSDLEQVAGGKGGTAAAVTAPPAVVSGTVPVAQIEITMTDGPPGPVVVVIVPCTVA